MWLVNRILFYIGSEKPFFAEEVFLRLFPKNGGKGFEGLQGNLFLKVSLKKKERTKHWI
jgi:hypothetical protein